MTHIRGLFGSDPSGHRALESTSVAKRAATRKNTAISWHYVDSAFRNPNIPHTAVRDEAPRRTVVSAAAAVASALARSVLVTRQPVANASAGDLSVAVVVLADGADGSSPENILAALRCARAAAARRRKKLRPVGGCTRSRGRCWRSSSSSSCRSRRSRGRAKHLRRPREGRLQREAEAEAAHPREFFAIVDAANQAAASVAATLGLIRR